MERQDSTDSDMSVDSSSSTSTEVSVVSSGSAGSSSGNGSSNSMEVEETTDGNKEQEKKAVGDDEVEESMQLKAKANQLFGKGEYAMAEKYYSQAIELNPTDAKFYGNRAFTYIKLEQYGAAIADAEKALELDPEYIKAWYRIGTAKMALGKYGEAKRCFVTVVQAKPRDKDARANYKACVAAMEQQEFADALDIGDDEEASVFSEVDVQHLDVPAKYELARIENNEITREWVLQTMQDFSDQKLIHTNYVYLILSQAKRILSALPPILSHTLPESDKFTVCGDVHGQFYDLMNIFELNGLPSPDNPYLFNGDFVDRGSFSCEVILTLLAWKCVYPESFHLHRGNHETVNMNKMYGFEGEVKAKYGMKAMTMFTEVFQALPLCSVIQDKVFVCHGGLFSRDNVTLDDIAQVDRFSEPPDSGIMCELLWSDPSMFQGRQPSKRGVGVAFGADVTNNFLATNQLDLVVRSHEVKPAGYEEEHNGKCITIFSAPNYCDQVGNKGAFINFDSSMQPKYVQFDAVPHPAVRPMAYASPFLGF